MSLCHALYLFLGHAHLDLDLCHCKYNIQHDSHTAGIVLAISGKSGWHEMRLHNTLPIYMP
jgi:hypothetical protein